MKGRGREKKGSEIRERRSEGESWGCGRSRVNDAFNRPGERID